MVAVRNGLIAALDVGTHKVCCFIARVQDDGTPRIVGIGHQLARGMRNGSVVDMEELETSIRAAVDAAEEMAGERVRAVGVNISGGLPGSANVKVEVAMNGHPVNEADIRRMLDHGRAHHESPDRELIHAIPVDYTIDGNEGIKDPRGMFGDRLGVAIHVISATVGPVRNLTSVVNRCHLDIEARVVSPYAAGLACLVDDEKELGVTCIDMGAGTTSIAVFLAGQLIHTDLIPIGGAHVTSDIARGLSTPLAQAERMKTLYGSAIPTPSDDREILKVPLVGEDEDGASQMQGARDLAGLVLDKQVRLGRPVGLQGLPEATAGPAFSVCAGLIRYALVHGAASTPRGRRGAIGGGGEEGSAWGRLGGWLKRNF